MFPQFVGITVSHPATYCWKKKMVKGRDIEEFEHLVILRSFVIFKSSASGITIRLSDNVELYSFEC